MADRGVVVDVDDAVVGGDLLDRGAGPNVVAVEDRVHGVPVDQALGRLDVGGIAHLGSVFEGWLQRTAKDAAQRIDFLAGQRQAVLELDTVGRGEIGGRPALADRDRVARSARLVVHRKQHGRHAGQRRGGGKAALDQEVAARASNDVRCRCLGIALHLNSPCQFMFLTRSAAWSIIAV